MEKARRHERVSLLADIVILPGQKSAIRFAGRVFNISRGGLAVFSPHYFPPGVLLVVELTIPIKGEGLRRATLYGVTRWVHMEEDGAVLGVELLKDTKAGDYTWFAEHFDLCIGAQGRGRDPAGATSPGSGGRTDR